MFLERCSFFFLSLTVDYYRESGKMFQSLKENSHAKSNTSRNVCHQVHDDLNKRDQVSPYVYCEIHHHFW